MKIEGSEHVAPCDPLIVAIGNGPNPVLTKTFPGLALDARGNIPVDEAMMTNVPGVFAGGDNGSQRQFELMNEKRKCSTLFHLLVPGGK